MRAGLREIICLIVDGRREKEEGLPILCPLSAILCDARQESYTFNRVHINVSDENRLDARVAGGCRIVCQSVSSA